MSAPHGDSKSADRVAKTMSPDEDQKFPERIMATRKILFPHVLHTLLESKDQDVTDTVAWLPDGNAFRIIDRKQFESVVMPRYFNSQSSKYLSFTRKLNRWGFKQITKGPECGAFKHEHFIRGKPDICSAMICKRTGGQNRGTRNSFHPLPSNPFPPFAGGLSAMSGMMHMPIMSGGHGHPPGAAVESRMIGPSFVGLGPQFNIYASNSFTQPPPPPPPPPPPQPQPRQQQQQSQFSLTQDLPLNLLLPSKGLQYQMPTVPDASIIPQPAQIINLVDPQQQEKLKEILLIQNIELLRLQQELMQHHTLKQGQSIQLQNLNASER